MSVRNLHSVSENSENRNLMLPRAPLTPQHCGAPTAPAPDPLRITWSPTGRYLYKLIQSAVTVTSLFFGYNKEWTVLASDTGCFEMIPRSQNRNGRWTEAVNSDQSRRCSVHPHWARCWCYSEALTTFLSNQTLQFRSWVEPSKLLYCLSPVTWDKAEGGATWLTSSRVESCACCSTFLSFRMQQDKKKSSSEGSQTKHTLVKQRGRSSLLFWPQTLEFSPWWPESAPWPGWV